MCVWGRGLNACARLGKPHEQHALKSPAHSNTAAMRATATTTTTITVAAPCCVLLQPGFCAGAKLIPLWQAINTTPSTHVCCAFAACQIVRVCACNINAIPLLAACALLHIQAQVRPLYKRQLCYVLQICLDVQHECLRMKRSELKQSVCIVRCLRNCASGAPAPIRGISIAHESCIGPGYMKARAAIAATHRHPAAR